MSTFWGVPPCKLMAAACKGCDKLLTTRPPLAAPPRALPPRLPASQQHGQSAHPQHAAVVLAEGQVVSTTPQVQGMVAPTRRRYRPGVTSSVPWLHADPGESPDDVVLPSHSVTAQVLAATTSAILATSVPMLAACWDVPPESMAPNLGVSRHNQPATVAAAVAAASTAERAKQTLRAASWVSPVSMQPGQLVETVYQLGKQGQVPSAQWMQECVDACELLFLQQARSRRAVAASTAPQMPDAPPQQTQHVNHVAWHSNPAPAAWGTILTNSKAPPLQGNISEGLSNDTVQLSPHQLCMLLWGLVRLFQSHKEQQVRSAWPGLSAAWVDAVCAAAMEVLHGKHILQHDSAAIEVNHAKQTQHDGAATNESGKLGENLERAAVREQQVLARNQQGDVRAGLHTDHSAIGQLHDHSGTQAGSAVAQQHDNFEVAVGSAAAQQHDNFEVPTGSATAQPHDSSAAATGRHYGRSTLQAMSTTLWALAALQLRPKRGWLIQWIGLSQPALRCMSSQDVVQMVWGCARLGHAPAAAWMQAAVMRTQQLLVSARCSPQDFANLLWSCARLGYDPGDRYLAVSFQALAANHRSHNLSSSAARHGSHDLSISAAQQREPLIGDVCCQASSASLIPPLPKHQSLAPASELNLNAADRASTSRPSGAQGEPQDANVHLPQQQQQQPLCQDHLEVSSQLAAYQPHDIAQVIWALGKLQKQCTAGILHTLLHTLCLRSSSHPLPEQDLVNVLWGLVRLQYQPAPAICSWLMHCIGQALRQKTLTPRGLPTLMWCLARLPWTVPANLTYRLFAAATILAPRFTLEGVAMVLYYAARKGYRVGAWHLAALTEVVVKYKTQPGSRHGTTAPQTKQHSSSTGMQHAGAPSEPLQHRGGTEVEQVQAVPLKHQAGRRPNPASTQAAACTSARGLWVTGTPQSAGLLMWSLAKLRFQPQASWFRVMASGTVQLLPHASATDLCFMLWALGFWRHRPPRYWALAALQRAAELSAQGLLRPDQASRVAYHMSALVSKSQLQAALKGQQTEEPRQAAEEVVTRGLRLRRPARVTSLASR